MRTLLLLTYQLIGIRCHATYTVAEYQCHKCNQCLSVLHCRVKLLARITSELACAPFMKGRCVTLIGRLSQRETLAYITNCLELNVLSIRMASELDIQLALKFLVRCIVCY